MINGKVKQLFASFFRLFIPPSAAMLLGCAPTVSTYYKPESGAGEIVGSNCHGAAPPYGTHQQHYGEITQKVRISNSFILIEYWLTEEAVFALGDFSLRFVSEGVVKELQLGIYEGVEWVSVDSLRSAGGVTKTCEILGIFGCKNELVYDFLTPIPKEVIEQGYPIVIDPPDIELNGESYVTPPIRFNRQTEAALTPLNC